MKSWFLKREYPKKSISAKMVGITFLISKAKVIAKLRRVYL